MPPSGNHATTTQTHSEIPVCAIAATRRASNTTTATSAKASFEKGALLIPPRCGGLFEYTIFDFESYEEESDESLALAAKGIKVTKEFSKSIQASCLGRMLLGPCRVHPPACWHRKFLARSSKNDASSCCTSRGPIPDDKSG